MKFRIDEDILRKTRCEKSLSCLSGQSNDLCKVEHCVSGKVCFIEGINNGLCHHIVPFGEAYTCNCPIRIELYRKYRI